MSVPLLRILDLATTADAERRTIAGLDEGKLVVLPTETVYGAAGRLDRPAAVDRLRAMRGETSGPFVIHAPDAEAIAPFVGPVTKLAARMMAKLWPGPVAITFDVPEHVRAVAAQRLGLAESDLYAPDGTITVRCPDHPFTLDCLARIDGPIAMSRVDTRNGDEPFDATTLAALPTDDIALVVDAGRTRFAKPSTIVRIEGESYRVVRDGVFDERIIARQLKTTLLFVCSGNTCRSPMASAIAIKQLRNAFGGKPDALATADVEVISAGTFAMPGLRATPQAVEAVAELGGDLGSHRSRQLSPEMIHAADYVITMGRSHAQAVLAMAPTAARRVISLDPAGDVEDPIGGDLALYRSVASRFESLVADRLAETVLAPPDANARPATKSEEEGS